MRHEGRGPSQRYVKDWSLGQDKSAGSKHKALRFSCQDHHLSKQSQPRRPAVAMQGPRQHVRNKTTPKGTRRVRKTDILNTQVVEDLRLADPRRAASSRARAIDAQLSELSESEDCTYPPPLTPEQSLLEDQLFYMEFSEPSRANRAPEVAAPQALGVSTSQEWPALRGQLVALVSAPGSGDKPETPALQSSARPIAQERPPVFESLLATPVVLCSSPDSASSVYDYEPPQIPYEVAPSSDGGCSTQGEDIDWELLSDPGSWDIVSEDAFEL